MQKSRKKFWIVFTSIIASLVLVGLVCGLVTRVKTVTVEFRARASAGYTMLEDGVLDKVAKAGEFDTKKSLLFMNFEENIAKINYELNPKLKTIYFRAIEETISSSMVREFMKYDKPIDKYVPKQVLHVLFEDEMSD